MRTQQICDYALIGDSRAAALVGKNGSIDWCCLPEFDSPAIFAALLGDNGGYFSLAPTGEFVSRQQYEHDTNVVKTTFQSVAGIACLSDAFSVMSEEDKTKGLFPDHEILRILEGVNGVVEFRLEFVPRLYYGKYTPKIKCLGKLGIHFAWKEHIYVFNSSLPLASIHISESESKVLTTFKVSEGDRLIFSLTYSNQSPAIIPEIETTAIYRMNRTIVYWKNWISKCNYRGAYLEQVKRSALVLKLLSHAPSGSLVAAPTTSLPEALGGDRNWDYRYCWLRDASFTTRALTKLGYQVEMDAYLNWILHATQLTSPRLQVVYSVYGKTRLKETEAHWLTGYANSRPVRLGNGAHAQFQLDVYGEVLDAIYTYAKSIRPLDNSMRKFALGLGKVICDTWDDPDNGIWEIRSPDKHHTHSKVMAWVGLDRLLKLAEECRWRHAPIAQFEKVRDMIRDQIESRGFNTELNSYTREFGSTDVDASLLILPLVQYCDMSSPGMRGTVERICATLSDNNLVYRYKGVDDGVNGPESAFAICSFWLAENFVMMNQVEKGIAVFETVLKHASTTGLLSEEIDTRSGAMLGNYPQAFTHIGLINAAVTIAEHQNKEN